MYPDLSLDKSVHAPYLSATPQVRPTFRLAWEVINDRLRIGSIGISPLPGTPPAAHFCYGSIIIPCICHRPPSVVVRLHSKYRFIARAFVSENRLRFSGVCPKLRNTNKRNTNAYRRAPFELGLLAHHKINAGKVLDEWVFGCQRSSLLAEKENRQRVFVPLHLFPHLKAIFQPPIPKKFFNLFSAAATDFATA